MADEITPVPELARAEARLPRWMLGVAVAGVLATLFTGSPQAALAFVVGSGVAILNYYWLHQAVVTFVNAGSARLPRFAVAKFTVRFPLAFAGVFLFYKTGWLPAGPILAGLFVPVVGVLLEALVQLREGLRA